MYVYSMLMLKWFQCYPQRAFVLVFLLQGCPQDNLNVTELLTKVIYITKLPTLTVKLRCYSAIHRRCNVKLPTEEQVCLNATLRCK